MQKKFYPIIITKTDKKFCASIIELGIKSFSTNQDEAVKQSIMEKDKILKYFTKNNIPFPKSNKNFDKLNTFGKNKFKTFFSFILRSICATLIFLATTLIVIVIIFPFLKAYINSDKSAIHLQQLTNKIGKNICSIAQCQKKND
jgi:hypothetical protein|tara:strand:+ start:1044 stop:1475 length:432 start_codon:yes stop_codon:yes gene_type:complete